MLVSKKMEIHPGASAVELLAGEDTSQSYELRVTTNNASPVWIGGPDVSSADSSPLLYDQFRVSGESLWVIGPASGTGFAALTILAYSTE